MLKLWGRINSINVQKVVFCLDEIGRPYERHEAGMQFGVVDTPVYRAMNPNGLVPVLEDGPEILWESNAIVRYLAAAYAPDSLWPAEPGARARADRWMDWQQTTLNPAMGPAFHGLVRTPPEKRDAAAIEASRDRTEKALAILDAALADRAHLAGDAFTMADVVVAPQIFRWRGMPVARAPHAHVERWAERIFARAGFARLRATPVT